MKKRNMLSLMALSCALLVGDIVNAAQRKKMLPSRQQPQKRMKQWKNKMTAFWNKIEAQANLLTDLKNESNVNQALTNLKEIVAKKMERWQKRQVVCKKAPCPIRKLPPKIQQLNDIIASLEIQTPEGREKARQLLNDMLTKHKERIMKMKKGKATGKVAGKKGKWRGKRRPGQKRARPAVTRSQNPEQPTALPMMAPTPAEFTPSAPPAEDVELVSSTEWLETPKSE